MILSSGSLCVRGDGRQNCLSIRVLLFRGRYSRMLRKVSKRSVPGEEHAKARDDCRYTMTWDGIESDAMGTFGRLETGD